MTDPQFEHTEREYLEGLRPLDRQLYEEHLRSPRERWGTCCPSDPECEHSFLDVDDLARWMDRPITDAEADHFGSRGGSDV